MAALPKEVYAAAHAAVHGFSPLCSVILAMCAAGGVRQKSKLLSGSLQRFDASRRFRSKLLRSDCVPAVHPE